MKLRYYLSSALMVTLLLFSSCANQLKEEVFSQLDPATLFQSVNGIERVLYGGYKDAQYLGQVGNCLMLAVECTGDHNYQTGGGVNLDYILMINYSWDASSPAWVTTKWNNMYTSIHKCNLVLENIAQSPVDAAIKDRFIAEARFVRASAFYALYMYHGPIPLRLSTGGDLAMARATEQEMQAFFEKEFTEAANDLPKRGEITGYQYGRATKEAALGYLCKFYLNTKQWQKCADVAKQIMDLGIYQLWPDYTTLFTVENEEKNKEFIWVYTCDPSNSETGNERLSGSLPASFARTVDGSVVFTSNMLNPQAKDRLYDSFYNSFDPTDKRRKLIITEYINLTGKTISLLNSNNTRSFKFPPDPRAVGKSNGNDLPVIRYADILLARAEALNELAGPTQEALGLIQMVRNRAGLTTPLVLANFTKETLRDHILNERGWEFYTEGLRRQDLIRHGKLISRALARGATNAKEYHQLFPIPQTEINANPLCIQNPGY